MRVRLMRGLATALFGLALGVRAVAGPVAWVQMTGSGAEARIVTDAPVCPSIRVGAAVRPMMERAVPVPGFANRVCAAALRPGDGPVTVAGQVLHAPSARPNRVVILGDSGCRLRGNVFQHCRDPSGWPFARIAALAASHRPDLVIHVGDYYYREAPCPPLSAAACGASPYGDIWATWKAELFDPAAPLLAAAPWVFARGNHEDCKRGGGGWFRLLDATTPARACPEDSATFRVDLGGLDLFVVDSADAEDLLPTPGGVSAFSARLDSIDRRRPDTPAWLVTHRPVWNPARLADLVGDGLVNATERQAVRGRPLPGVDLIVSGHVHNFASLSFGPARPAQIVVGTGGDLLDLESAPPPTTGSAGVDGMRADIFTMGRWGFFVFDRHGRDWDGKFYDAHDRVAAICRLHRRDLSCRRA